MSNNDIVNEIVSLSSKIDKELLREYDEGNLEYWDGNNADDTFAMGISVGYEMALEQVLHLLGYN